LIRTLEVGQAAYINRGGVTYLQVKRLVLGPAAVTGRSSPAPRRSSEPGQIHVPAADRTDEGARAGVHAGGTARQGQPDVRPVLDAAFGPDPVTTQHASVADNQESRP